MSFSRKFLIGGLGGLLPVLVSLLAIDIAAIIDHRNDITLGMYVGYVLRDIVLFVLGGVLAALNDATKPLTLVQLGIAAPALITSFINGSAIAPKSESDAMALPQAFLSVFPPAYAEEQAEQHQIVVAGAFLDDVFRGITEPLAKVSRDPPKKIGDADVPPPGIDPAPETYQFYVTNHRTGSCWTIVGHGLGEGDMDSWRRLYPQPEYDVQRGSCSE